MESCIVVSQRGFTVRHYLARVLIIKCFISGLYICIFDLNFLNLNLRSLLRYINQFLTFNILHLI